MAYTEATKEAIWLRSLLSEIDMRMPLNEMNRNQSKWGQQPITILIDNSGAHEWANNPKHHDRTKHIDIRHHFIRGAIQQEQVDLHRIPSNENTADIFTKPLSKAQFEQHRNDMGVKDIDRVE